MLFAKCGQKSGEKILSSFARELELETCEVVVAVLGQIPRSRLLVVCEHFYGKSSYLLLWRELGNNWATLVAKSWLSPWKILGC